MQSLTLLLVVVVLAIFEIDLRMRGGSEFLDQLPDRAAIVRAILRAHIGIATVTFFAWLSLAVISWRRLSLTLPGSFSRLHRAAGRFTVAGECVVAASGALMYLLLYVV